MDFYVNYHYVCLPCRKSAKYSEPSAPTKCPHCGEAMQCVGKKFAAPSHHDLKGWKKIEWMVHNGWKGYSWPTTPKMNLREVRESLVATKQKQLAARHREKSCKSFEDAKRRARRNLHKSKVWQKRQLADLKAQEKYQSAVMDEIKVRQSI